MGGNVWELPAFTVLLQYRNWFSIQKQFSSIVPHYALIIPKSYPDVQFEHLFLVGLVSEFDDYVFVNQWCGNAPRGGGCIGFSFR